MSLNNLKSGIGNYNKKTSLVNNKRKKIPTKVGHSIFTACWSVSYEWVSTGQSVPRLNKQSIVP